LGLCRLQRRRVDLDAFPAGGKALPLRFALSGFAVAPRVGVTPDAVSPEPPQQPPTPVFLAGRGALALGVM